MRIRVVNLQLFVCLEILFLFFCFLVLVNPTNTYSVFSACWPVPLTHTVWQAATSAITRMAWPRLPCRAGQTVTTWGVDCAGSLFLDRIFPSLPHLAAGSSGLGSPQNYCTMPVSPPSLSGPRERAEHSVRSTRCRLCRRTASCPSHPTAAAALLPAPGLPQAQSDPASAHLNHLNLLAAACRKDTHLQAETMGKLYSKKKLAKLAWGSNVA